jgi:hypothetical protein
VVTLERVAGTVLDGWSGVGGAGGRGIRCEGGAAESGVLGGRVACMGGVEEGEPLAELLKCRRKAEGRRDVCCCWCVVVVGVVIDRTACPRCPLPAPTVCSSAPPCALAILLSRNASSSTLCCVGALSDVALALSLTLGPSCWASKCVVAACAVIGTRESDVGISVACWVVSFGPVGG